MANLKLRYLVVIFILTAAGFAVSGLQYESFQDEESALADLQAIPMRFGEWWQGKEFPLEEMIYEILETRAIIHRLFTGSNGDNVFLSIVHYSDTKVDFHAPETCLGGEGLKTVKNTKVITFFSSDQKITLEVAEMVTTRDTGKTLTYYFYKSGKFTGSNYMKMRLGIAANKLARNDVKGSLIRISTKLTPGHKAEAEALLTGFLQDFFPYVQQAL